MKKMMMMTGLVVGAYVAGYNEITHVEVMEMVETVMTHVEGMLEYVESHRGEISSVVENVNKIAEGVL